MSTPTPPQVPASRDGAWQIDTTPGDHFVELVGPLLTRDVSGERRFAFRVQRKHTSRFDRLHGGMLMYLADKAMSVTAWHLVGRPKAFSTIQLDVQFMATVGEGSLLQAQCELVRRTGSLAFMSGRLTVGDDVVAQASGVWKFR